jgi:hypothetical protein
MCKSFVEIKDGKVIRTKGKFKKGFWLVCLECGIGKLKYPRRKDGTATVLWHRSVET